ncbi:MAG: tetratricopeptide repeat protein, partial [Proteobacteria bacterium]|nr:tetratricopeptide repeat protein [Pseudomonadota bacterium]
LSWGCLIFPLRVSNSKLDWKLKIVLVIFPLLPILLYCWLGDSCQLNQYWAWQRQENVVQQQMAQIKNPQQLIERLQNHLQADPNSAEGWYLLGKLYLDQNQYSNAESALKKASELSPKSIDVFVALAKANFFNHQGRLDQSILNELTKRVESADNPPVDALNLLAVNCYREKNYSQAVQYWQKALSLVAPNSPDSRALMDMISQAQKQEG